MRYAQSVLEGEDGDIGLVQLAGNYQHQIHEVELKLRSPSIDSKSPSLLHQRQRHLKRQFDETNGEIECLRRLMHDEAMQDVYKWLETTSVTDGAETAAQPAVLFIHAALAARADYSLLAAASRKIDDLRAKIERLAAKLAELLRDLEAQPIAPPATLISTRALLRATGRPYEDLGAAEETVESTLDLPEPSEITEGGDCSTDRLAEFLSALPAPHELLERIAAAAHYELSANAESMTGAALRSRQRQAKTDYLRAFMHALTVNGAFTDSTTLRNAIATTATIVINDKNIVVSLDDVTKATKATP